MSFRCLYPIAIPEHPTFDFEKIIKDSLQEDGGDIGDISSLSIINDESKSNAYLLAKDDGIIAGVCVADKIFELYDSSVIVNWNVKDGILVKKGDIIATIYGNTKSILVCERVCLNFMQRMSGIATLTSEMVKKVANYKTKVLDTRKTAPGLRVFDKWAVKIGGGQNHRLGLYDMVMIKDNHIAAAGNIKNACLRTREYIKKFNIKKNIKIEVETSTLEEVEEVKNLIKSGVKIDRVMLDNMTTLSNSNNIDVSMLIKALNILDDIVETEASGNVSINTIEKIASTGVMYVSIGSLTHSVKAMDISLKFN